MGKIAIEEHYQSEIFDQYNQNITENENFPDFFDDPAAKAERIQNLHDIFFAPVFEHRIPVMDRLGIDIQILSPDTQAVQYEEDPGKAVGMAKHINDLTARLAAGAPDRLRALALLPMQDPQAAVGELKKRVCDQGFVGAFVHGHTGMKTMSYYDEEKYDIVWQTLEELDVPLFMHPRNPEPDQVRMYQGYGELLGNTWNWGYVTATHVLRMIIGGVFERHPKAKLILGHMGEMLPYMLGRLDEGYECRGGHAAGKITDPPSVYLKRNLYIATSGGYRPEVMRCAIQALGADKILFGTDYPHFPTETAVRQLEACGLSEEEHEAICYRNAKRIFKL